MKERKKAVALKYEMNRDAPIVTANGMGHIGEKIIENAEKSQVPIVCNKELADLLCNLDIGDSIPEDVYEAVAHIIGYIIDIDERIER